jgi:hypothetical protein
MKQDITVNRFQGNLDEWLDLYSVEVGVEEQRRIRENIKGILVAQHDEDEDEDEDEDALSRYSYYLGDLTWITYNTSDRPLSTTFSESSPHWEKRLATQEEEELFYIGRISL